MPIASAARHQTSYVREVSVGVTPANPAMQALRHTTCSLGLSRDSFTSNEKRPDRQIADVRTGTDKISGSIGFELSLEAFDDFLEACLAGTWQANVLKVGTEQRSFTIERGFPDIGQYLLYRGCFVNKLSLSVKPNAMITGSFDVVGLSGAVGAAPLNAHVAPAPTHMPYDSYTGELKEGGTALAVVTGIDISLDNGIAAQYGVFQRSAKFVDWGKSTVTGTMTAFFEDASLIAKFLDETPTSLEFTIGSNVNGYTFLLPSIRYTGSEAPMQSDGPISISLPFAAKLDPVTGTNLRITRHGVVQAVPPLLTSSTPADNATDVAVNTPLTLTFDKSVKAGVGNITITNGNDDVRVISMADASVAIAGAVITVTPATSLKAADVYHVLVDATAVTGLDGAPFAGIADSTTLNFATA